MKAERMPGGALATPGESDSYLDKAEEASQKFKETLQVHDFDPLGFTNKNFAQPNFDEEPLISEQAAFSDNVNHDNVNHPKHYNSHPSGVEVIEIIGNFNFCLGNAFKYVARYNLKGNPAEDLNKAIWYLKHEILRRDSGLYPGTVDPFIDANSLLETYINKEPNHNVAAILLLIYLGYMERTHKSMLNQAIHFIELLAESIE